MLGEKELSSTLNPCVLRVFNLYLYIYKYNLYIFIYISLVDIYDGFEWDLYLQIKEKQRKIANLQ